MVVGPLTSANNHEDQQFNILYDLQNLIPENILFHCLGLEYSFNCDRLIHFTKIINNQLCFPEKMAFNIYELYINCIL